MPEIAFIMGKSASGKDRIYRTLVEDRTLNLKTVTLYTTRPMREGETEGKEYFFVDSVFLQNMSDKGKIIELRSYDTVYGVWNYFTADDGQIKLQSGDKYIVIGTLEAYNKYCEYYGKEHIMPIYIEVEDGIRLERALNREREQKTPKYDEMCRRFLADAKDFSQENLSRSEIVKTYYNNGLIEDCISEIKRDIKENL